MTIKEDIELEMNKGEKIYVCRDTGFAYTLSELLNEYEYYKDIDDVESDLMSIEDFLNIYSWEDIIEF